MPELVRVVSADQPTGEMDRNRDEAVEERCPPRMNRMQENITLRPNASIVTPRTMAGRVQARNKVSSARRSSDMV